MPHPLQDPQEIILRQLFTGRVIAVVFTSGEGLTISHGGIVDDPAPERNHLFELSSEAAEKSLRMVDRRI